MGDITKISGYTAPIVDCVIGGSPCQDLSVAGKRAGLEGERSGLFMEQIRIVKELRKQDERNGRTDVDIRPRYMVWENVPGAFSSNKGEDFRVVLEEIAKVKDENASVPMPKDGKWTTSGSIVGDGWSIAWRVLDAQFWGVPQRRRRIALVADFGGESASEILFVSKSLSGHTDESKPKRKDLASNVTGGSYADDCSSYTMQDREGKDGGGKGALIQEEKSASLRTNNFQYLFQPVTFSKHKRAQSDTDFETWKESDKANTLNGFDTGDVRTNEAVVYAVDQGGGKSSANVTEGKTPTLTCTHGGEPVVSYQDRVGSLCARDFKGVGSQYVEEDKLVCYTIDEKCANTYVWEEQANTLAARDYKQPQTVVAVDCRNGTESEVNGALQSNSAHSLNGNNTVRTRYIVRRLTPLECERLQGYPNGWTDIGEYIDSNGKKRQTSDASRYKALGNSIALPPWKWVLKRISACYERDATMASLFSGIGGFDLIWTQLNGAGSVLWESEIDEFPMAVCKKHFGDETTGEKGDFYEYLY